MQLQWPDLCNKAFHGVFDSVTEPPAQWPPNFLMTCWYPFYEDTHWNSGIWQNCLGCTMGNTTYFAVRLIFMAIFELTAASKCSSF